MNTTYNNRFTTPKFYTPMVLLKVEVQWKIKETKRHFIIVGLPPDCWAYSASIYTECHMGNYHLSPYLCDIFYECPKNKIRSTRISYRQRLYFMFNMFINFHFFKKSKYLMSVFPQLTSKFEDQTKTTMYKTTLKEPKNRSSFSSRVQKPKLLSKIFLLFGFLEWQPCHSYAGGFGFHQNYHTIEL